MTAHRRQEPTHAGLCSSAPVHSGSHPTISVCPRSFLMSGTSADLLPHTRNICGWDVSITHRALFSVLRPTHPSPGAQASPHWRCQQCAEKFTHLRPKGSHKRIDNRNRRSSSCFGRNTNWKDFPSCHIDTPCIVNVQK